MIRENSLLPAIGMRPLTWLATTHLTLKSSKTFMKHPQTFLTWMSLQYLAQDT